MQTLMGWVYVVFSKEPQRATFQLYKTMMKKVSKNHVHHTIIFPSSFKASSAYISSMAFANFALA